jgi:hypothetical protein
MQYETFKASDKNKKRFWFRTHEEKPVKNFVKKWIRKMPFQSCEHLLEAVISPEKPSRVLYSSVRNLLFISKNPEGFRA